jgi:ribokinase
LAQALVQASAAGALACTKLGAQSSIPTHAEVAAFMQQQAPSQTKAQAKTQALRHFCGFSTQEAPTP